MIKKMLKKAIGVYYSMKYRGFIKRNKPLKGNYGSFRFISEYSIDSFKKIKIYNDKFNIASLKDKRKIKFGFVVYTSSMWNVDELYRLLSKNVRFDTKIIIAHINIENKEASNDEYNRTLSYFQNMKYSVMEANSIKDINKFDLLFYLTPSPLVESQVDLINVPMSVIVLHTSYSYMLAGNMHKLDVGMYHWSLRYYTDSEYYKELIEKNRNFTGNAKYLGFPKMDQYYASRELRLSNKKVIIYAPHHSVNYTEFKSATFEDNYLAILELAKKYSDTTYWIYKPHPLLRANSVLAGIFKSADEYDEYERKWQELDNAEVINQGDYFSIFRGSDAMITDSVSFLAEYQFTQKPLLLLESGKEKYNGFGNEILKILYKCRGNEIVAIEKFVKNVIDDIDDMSHERKNFFDNNLFYMQNGETANRRIYNDIIELITDKESGETF